MQLLAAHVALLGLAGGERRDFHRARRGVGADGLEDFRPPCRELAQVLVGEALDLGDPPADLLPLDSDEAGQLVAKLGLIEVAGGLGVLVDRRVVEPGPLAVRPLGRVGYQDVGVQLGVAVSRGAVLEGGGEVAVALDELRTACAAPGPARLLLEIAKCRLDGGAMGLLYLDARNGSAQAPEEGDRLRGREGQVEAGDRPAAADRSQPERLAARRVVTGEHPGQLIRLDLPGEVELDGGIAHPLPADLALAGVVVLRAFGDLLQVVHLLAGSELSDGQQAISVRSASVLPRSIWKVMRCEGGGSSLF